MANTHLGVSASDIVLLEAVGVVDSPNPKDSLAFFRTEPSHGEREPSGGGTFGYTAPDGRGIVITEVDWQYAYGSPGENQTLRVILLWDTIERRALESTIILGSSGAGGTTTSVTTGILVPSKVKIMVDITPAGSGKLQHVLIRGYLVDL